MLFAAWYAPCHGARRPNNRLVALLRVMVALAVEIEFGVFNLLVRLASKLGIGLFGGDHAAVIALYDGGGL